MGSFTKALLSSLAAALSFAAVPAPPAPLIAHPAIVVPRANGFFDYMLVDAPRRRLIVAHTGSESVAFS